MIVKPDPSTVQAEEQQLVNRLRAGDSASYEHLVRTYGGRMLTVTRRMLRNDHDAEDSVQEAFLHAFKNIARFEERSSLGTWLHRIAVNAALTRIRKYKRRPEDSLEDLLPNYDDQGHRLEREAEWSISVETLFQSDETRTVVRDKIDRLPEGYRNVLILRDVEGYTTEEVAASLEMTAGAVKTRLHRARAALKTLLEPLMQEENL